MTFHEDEMGSAVIKTASGDQIFRSSKGLRVVLGFAFFFAVLFAINAIVGSAWLGKHHLWLDAFISFILFGVGCWLVFFAGAFLLGSLNTDICLQQDGVAMQIPHWRGPTPYIPYLRTKIAYHDIAAIETRSEVYYYYVMPVVVRSLVLVLKNGKRLHIGYTRENAKDNAFAYDELAKALSERSGVAITDRGIVKAGLRLRALLHENADEDRPQLSPAAASQYRFAESKIWRGVMIACVAIVLVGSAYQGIKIVNTTFASPTAAHPSHR